MGPQQITAWYGGILITLITAHLAIHRFASNLISKKHPKLSASVVSVLITAVAAITTYFVDRVWYMPVILVTIGFGLLLALLWTMTKPTETAFDLLTYLLDSLFKIDRQICYIMSEIVATGGGQINEPLILNAFRHVLSEIERILITDHTHEITITLLSIVNDDGTCTVVETRGVSPLRRKQIEQIFGCSREKRKEDNNEDNIVDAVLQRKEEICIHDLEDRKNHEDAKLWVKIDSDDKKEGCLAGIPLLKGSDSNRRIMGVLIIQSNQKNAINCTTFGQVKSYYLDKLELLLYCSELNQYNPALKSVT